MGWGGSRTGAQLDELIAKAKDNKRLSGPELHKLEETARQVGSRGIAARDALKKRDSK